VANFTAFYRGRSVAEARLIAVSSESEMVSRFLRELAGVDEPEEQNRGAEPTSMHIVRGNEEQT